jgi:hypothetical protein
MEFSEMQNQVIVSLYSISKREAHILSLKEGVLKTIK